MSWSAHWADLIADGMCGITAWTAPAGIWLSLHDSGGTEITGGGYARAQVTAWDAAAKGADPFGTPSVFTVKTQNSGEVDFPTITGAYSATPGFLGLKDAASGGNDLQPLIALGGAPAPVVGQAYYVNAATVFLFFNDTFAVHFTKAFMAQVLDFITGRSAVAPHVIGQVGLLAGAGATNDVMDNVYTEISWSGYARIALSSGDFVAYTGVPGQVQRAMNGGDKVWTVGTGGYSNTPNMHLGLFNSGGTAVNGSDLIGAMAGGFSGIPLSAGDTVTWPGPTSGITFPNNFLRLN